VSPAGPSGAGPERSARPASQDSGHGRAFGVEVRSYHGQPVLKEPVWTWEIPLYFYTGGLAGGSAGLAVLSELRGNDILARRAWATALAGVTLSPALLTSDLGKPARFLNMLRMFKVTSPMSVGSWILTASGAATSLAAANSLSGLFPRLGRLAKPASALLGLPLSTYTGALVANTAIPAWHEARQGLPFVFGSGAALSAGAAAVMITPVDEARPARRLALLGAALEGPLMELMIRRLGEHGQVYKQGNAGRLANLSRACIAGGGLLLARRGRSSRGASIAAGALLSAGALATRSSVFRAGFQSAADPRYVVGSQRARVKRGERPGAARATARVTQPDPAAGSPALQLTRRP
jgi:formate-dependent nitrite reductase membrane component NrfD